MRNIFCLSASFCLVFDISVTLRSFSKVVIGAFSATLPLLPFFSSLPRCLFSPLLVTASFRSAIDAVNILFVNFLEAFSEVVIKFLECHFISTLHHDMRFSIEREEIIQILGGSYKKSHKTHYTLKLPLENFRYCIAHNLTAKIFRFFHVHYTQSYLLMY